MIRHPGMFQFRVLLKDERSRCMFQREIWRSPRLRGTLSLSRGQTLLDKLWTPLTIKGKLHPFKIRELLIGWTRVLPRNRTPSIYLQKKHTKWRVKPRRTSCLAPQKAGKTISPIVETAQSTLKSSPALLEVGDLWVGNKVAKPSWEMEIQRENKRQLESTSVKASPRFLWILVYSKSRCKRNISSISWTMIWTKSQNSKLFTKSLKTSWEPTRKSWSKWKRQRKARRRSGKSLPWRIDKRSTGKHSLSTSNLLSGMVLKEIFLQRLKELSKTSSAKSINTCIAPAARTIPKKNMTQLKQSTSSCPLSKMSKRSLTQHQKRVWNPKRRSQGMLRCKRIVSVKSQIWIKKTFWQSIMKKNFLKLRRNVSRGPKQERDSEVKPSKWSMSATPSTRKWRPQVASRIQWKIVSNWNLDRGVRAQYMKMKNNLRINSVLMISPCRLIQKKD